MSDANASDDTGDDSGDDWVAGGTLEGGAANLTFFGGSSVPVDTSLLPDPPDDDNVA